MTDREGAFLDDMVKRPCAFIININLPLQTSSEILGLLWPRNVRVKTMHLHMVNPEEGVLIIHCLIEKDRARYMLHLMEKMKGVLEIELLEGKMNNLKIYKHVD